LFPAIEIPTKRGQSRIGSSRKTQASRLDFDTGKPHPLPVM